MVSGDKLVKLLVKLGYEIVRRKGSHITLEKDTEIGRHRITIPYHKEIAKGTLNDILRKVSLWNGIPKEKLVEELTKI
ncbi:MAG: type II toxin-antitoxin system HicA family toxin [Archaeoglobaceae archaeon]|nr:type II toxin-antitoxin system HicA family toxin [Archaeoglobaceae archaeon]